MNNTPYTILTIDDDAHTRQYFRLVLEENKYRVLEAEDGATGLRIMNEDVPDVVLLDLRMPTMDGMDVLQQIRAISTEIPVIVVSGTDSIDEVVLSLRNGAWDFILKPLSSYNILVHQIEKVLERARLKKQNREYQTLLEDAVRTLEDDLKAGKEMQLKLLPKPELQIGNFRFNSLMLPSLYLSGDFLNYQPLNPRYTLFYFADVSGHGVSSALITVFLKHFFAGLIQNFLSGDNNDILHPDKVIAGLNKKILEERFGKFTTLFLGLIDNFEDEMHYCNAGQFPVPIINMGTKQLLLDLADTPVGISADSEYTKQVLSLNDFSGLTLFSDGILDILPQDNLDSKLTFLKEISGEKRSDLEELKGHLINSSNSLPDDISILTIDKLVP